MEDKKWISIKEAIPSFKQDVLVTWIVGGDNPHAFFDVGYVLSIITTEKGTEVNFCDKHREIIKPTHWMELPSSPTNVFQQTSSGIVQEVKNPIPLEDKTFWDKFKL